MHMSLSSTVQLAACSCLSVINRKRGVTDHGAQDLKPDLVFARISGYGQTGPKSQLAGYASVCEAYGGFR